jgi:hypothetical protein
MATGLIAAVGTGTSFIYTPPTNCKLILNTTLSSTSQGIFLNGLDIFRTLGGNTTQTFTQIPLYLAAGQTITITTPTSGYVLISSYEE